MNNVLLEINGPMCAGKSTLVVAFMEKDCVFNGSYDQVKRLISNYSLDDPDHREIAREITFQMISAAIASGLSVVVDGGRYKDRERYGELANKHGFKFLSVNIEAPYDVLKQRFLERVQAGKKIDRPMIAVTTIEEFDSRYKWYMQVNKNSKATATFDSSEMGVEEIMFEIDKLIM